ncbi:quinone oxidoreductase family protein [Mucilaginibacter sp. X4EP1]|jgi:NADPH:quinone reductase|uniref:quinone oxidoreductase family protein n=1 Tax=Mucilaginibacter sp. X4EP1 TaxID=2723092 RepID=UPI0021696256|nr:zinc-binding alcohol dehydrogenase family protein [Mucilaginibacter sp. X4EP1]MCS3812732.1 NADPH:quinone reductase-like Zn-dependent oxidoreductase [Mucilaginibacter sp. X4EP1]
MKAILLTDFGPTTNFVLDENVPIPAIGDNDILVQIKAAGFNPIDYQMRQGKTERKRMHSHILGREFSGVVVKTGKSVTLFKAGDSVFAASGSMGSNGTYAQYISVPEDIVALIPAHLTFDEAAAVSQGYLTALQVLNRLPVKKEDSIFITGAAGSVGLALVKMFLAQGYEKLIVTAGNTESIWQLVSAGLAPHQIVNYRQDGLVAKIQSINNGALFNHSVDLVGGTMSEICAQVIVTNGSYADVTALTTPQAREELFNKGALVLNISNYAYSLAGDKKWYGENLRKIASLVTEHPALTPDINIVGDLGAETVITAHNLMESNQTKGKKLVMRVGD